MPHPYPALPIPQSSRPVPPAVPCPEGFHWIGQSFASCDMCGLPAWEHAGRAALTVPDSPFGDGEWVLEPWVPGEAERIRAKWDPELPVWMCPEHRNQWQRFDHEDPADPPLAIGCCTTALVATTRGLG